MGKYLNDWCFVYEHGSDGEIVSNEKKLAFLHSFFTRLWICMRIQCAYAKNNSLTSEEAVNAEFGNFLLVSPRGDTHAKNKRKCNVSKSPLQ